MITDELNRYLLFNVGEETYATPLLGVREVVEYQPPKFIPNMASYFSGVINIRGSIVGVVDLRSKFGTKSELTKHTGMLVCDTDQGQIAAVVDKIDSVISFKNEEIEKNPPVQTKVNSEFLLGVAKYKDRLVTLVNLLKALSNDQLNQKIA